MPPWTRASWHVPACVSLKQSPLQSHRLLRKTIPTETQPSQVLAALKVIMQSADLVRNLSITATCLPHMIPQMTSPEAHIGVGSNLFRWQILQTEGGMWRCLPMINQDRNNVIRWKHTLQAPCHTSNSRSIPHPRWPWIRTWRHSRQNNPQSAHRWIVALPS